MLTNKQEQLLDIAKKKGFVTLNDSYFVYSSESARRNALNLLIKIGYLKMGTQANRFDLVEQRDIQQEALWGEYGDGRRKN